MTQDLNALDLKGLLEAAEAQKRRHQADVEAAAHAREQARLRCEEMVLQQIGDLLPKALRPHLKFSQWTRPYFYQETDAPTQPGWDAELVIQLRNFGQIVVRCTTTPAYDPSHDAPPESVTAQFVTGAPSPFAVVRWKLNDGVVVAGDSEYFWDILSALSRAQEIGDEHAALCARAEINQQHEPGTLNVSAQIVLNLLTSTDADNLLLQAARMLNVAEEKTDLAQDACGPYEATVAAALTGLLALEMHKVLKEMES